MCDPFDKSFVFPDSDWDKLVAHQHRCGDCGMKLDSFACKIRHLQVNTGAAKAARD